MKGDRVDVLWLLHSQQEKDSEVGEGVAAVEDGVEAADARALGVLLGQEGGLVEEVDEVAEGEESSPSCHDDDPSWRSAVKVEAETLGLAELEAHSLKLELPHSPGELTVVVDLHHYWHCGILSLFITLFIKEHLFMA